MHIELELKTGQRVLILASEIWAITEADNGTRVSLNNGADLLLRTSYEQVRALLSA